MNTIVIEKYNLKRRLFGEDQISFTLVPYNTTKTKALYSSNRLIYIVKHLDDYLYVGETKSLLKVRMNRGFNSFRHFKRSGKKRGGYGGYKWIKLFDEHQIRPMVNELTIIAVIFDKRYADKRTELQAIEGEIVFLIRQETAAWPLYQNEIHFNNEAKSAKRIAKEILNRISKM